MKKSLVLVLITLSLSAFVGACGGGGGAAPPPLAGPPPAAQDPGGIWAGQSVTAASPDVFTSFEFNAAGPFTVGAAPFTATFSNGRAETRGILAFYITGSNSWHILIGTSATVTFETLPSSVNFHVRMPSNADVGEVRILDENAALIQTTQAIPSPVFSR